LSLDIIESDDAVDLGDIIDPSLKATPLGLFRPSAMTKTSLASA
jgi:hypothetical protein